MPAAEISRQNDRHGTGRSKALDVLVTDRLITLPPLVITYRLLARRNLHCVVSATQPGKEVRAACNVLCVEHGVQSGATTNTG